MRFTRIADVLCLAISYVLLSSTGLQAQAAGVIDVQALVLPGSPTAADRIQECIDQFGAEAEVADASGTFRHVGGTCDAREVRGGIIDAQIDVNVDNVRIILGSGIYGVTGSNSGFLMTANNVTLEGQGASTHLEADARTGTGPVVDIGFAGGTGRAENISLRNLRISGNRPGLGDPAAPDDFDLIRARQVEGLRIERLRLEDGTRNALAVNGSTNGAQDVFVADNRIERFSRSGIRLDGDIEYGQVRNNLVQEVGAIADLGISGTGAIAIGGGSADGPRFIQVTGNTVNQSSAGIRMTALGSSIPTDVQVIGNAIDASRPNATVEGEGIATSGKNVQIIGNRVTDSRVNGVLLWSGNVENVALVGNMISNASQDPGGGHSGIALNTQGATQKQILVAANMAFDDQTTQTQMYLLSATVSGGSLWGTIQDLFAASNVGSGVGASYIHPQLESSATTTGNIPVVVVVE